MESFVYRDKKSLVVNFSRFLDIEKQIQTRVNPQKIPLLELAKSALDSAFNIDQSEHYTETHVDLLNYVSQVKMDASREAAKQMARSINHSANENFRRRHFDEAIKLYSKAIDYNPQNPAYYCNRAEAYNNTCFMINTMEDCRHALLLNPKYGRAYNRMALVNISAHNWAEAIKCCQFALACEPQNPVYHNNIKIAESGFNSHLNPLQFVPPYLLEFLIPLPTLPTPLLAKMTQVTFENIDFNGPVLAEDMTPADDDVDINPCGPFFLKE